MDIGSMHPGIILGSWQKGFQNRPCFFHHRLPSSSQKLNLGLKPLRADNSLLGRRLDVSVETFAKQFEGEEKTRTGRWRKDKSASDAMEEAMDMVALPWVFRKALLVLNVLEVDDNQEYFQTKIKAGGLMDVTERYPWDGAVTVHKRRDKRKGPVEGFVDRSPTGPAIKVRWGEPYGGEAVDTFELSEDGDSLVQVSWMKVPPDTGKETVYRTTYRRVHD